MTSPSDLFDLAGRVAIVTGSTKGLGKAMLEGFSRAGAAVVVSGRKQQSCDQVAAEIRAATGGDAIGLACHVGDWDAIAEFVAEVVTHFGRIDILVNNAGINPAVTDPHDVQRDLWRKVFAVNLEGPLRMTQMVAPVMRDNGGGSVINVGTMAAYAANSISIAYGASKAALRNLTVTLANEYAPWGVRVNILSPGPFATEMVAGAERNQPGFLDMLAQINPQMRVADVSEIVGPALYLASDASTFVTGDDITVSGGMRK
jgi:NAD(P)-dependent dehydrogenase (short-subunit alcohol dehydrogenase family)